MELSTICLDEDADAATSGSSGSRENPVNKDFGEYDEDSAFSHRLAVANYNVSDIANAKTVNQD